jgi:hypothetical protein
MRNEGILDAGLNDGHTPDGRLECQHLAVAWRTSNRETRRQDAGAPGHPTKHRLTVFIGGSTLNIGG